MEKRSSSLKSKQRSSLPLVGLPNVKVSYSTNDILIENLSGGYAVYNMNGDCLETSEEKGYVLPMFSVFLIVKSKVVQAIGDMSTFKEREV